MINLDMKNIKTNKNSFVLRVLIHTKKVIATSYISVYTALFNTSFTLIFN